MKLYIYTRNTFEQNVIGFHEAEAKETKKQYELLEKVPGFYNKRILKTQLGLYETESYHQTVVLTKPDHEKARSIFMQYLQSLIDQHQQEIDKLNNELKTIKDWRI